MPFKVLVSFMLMFDTLITDLTRDIQCVQPKDVLQFSTNWFQSRLEKQRTHTHDTLAHHPSLAANLPPDHYINTPVAPQPRCSTVSPFTDPFTPYQPLLQPPH